MPEISQALLDCIGRFLSQGGTHQEGLALTTCILREIEVEKLQAENATLASRLGAAEAKAPPLAG